MKRQVFLFVVGFLLFGTIGIVSASTITFDGVYQNGHPINPPHDFQTAYDTSHVDVYFSNQWKYWDSGYSDLQGVAYVVNVHQSAYIDFIAKPDSIVTLEDFDLGNWSDITSTTQYKVFDLTDLSTPILTATDIDVPYPTHGHYDVDLSSSAGLRLVFGPDQYYNAVDNINFSGTGAPVPEPSTMILLGCGLMGLVGLGRKKLQK